MNFRNKRRIAVGSKILINRELFTVKEIDKPWVLISPSNQKSGGWGVVHLSDIETNLINHNITLQRASFN
jgi:hypothetical protein